MGERYVRLCTFSSDLCAEGAPVQIKAGALLRDTLTDKLVVQLKFKNASDRQISSVTVMLKSEIKGNVAGQEITYGNLSAEAGADFGQQTPVVLTAREADAIHGSILAVKFADGTEYRPLDPQELTLASGKNMGSTLSRQTEKNYKKREFQILSWLPLVIAFVSIYAFISDFYWGRRNEISFEVMKDMWEEGGLAYIVSLLVPILCVMAVRKKKPTMKGIRISCGIAIACAVLQIAAVTAYCKGTTFAGSYGAYLKVAMSLGEAMSYWKDHNAGRHTLLRFCESLLLIKNFVAIWILAKWRKLNK